MKVRINVHPIGMGFRFGVEQKNGGAGKQFIKQIYYPTAKAISRI